MSVGLSRLEQSGTAKLGLNDVGDSCWRQKLLVTILNWGRRFDFFTSPWSTLNYFNFGGR